MVEVQKPPKYIWKEIAAKNNLVHFGWGLFPPSIAKLKEMRLLFLFDNIYWLIIFIYTMFNTKSIETVNYRWHNLCTEVGLELKTITDSTYLVNESRFPKTCHQYKIKQKQIWSTVFPFLFLCILFAPVMWEIPAHADTLREGLLRSQVNVAESVKYKSKVWVLRKQ